MFTRGYMICNPPNKNSRPSPYSCWKSSVKCSPRRNGIRMTTMTHQNMFSIYLNVWKILVLFWIYMWADILGYWTMSMKNLMRSGLLKKEAKFFEKNWLGTVSDSQMFWVIWVGQKTVGWASHFLTGWASLVSNVGFISQLNWRNTTLVFSLSGPQEFAVPVNCYITIEHHHFVAG